MFDLASLSQRKLDICQNTISSNAFYLIVGHCLSSSLPLSVVRMADGEHHLLTEIQSNDTNTDWLNAPITGYDGAWMVNMGCLGISRRELLGHLRFAADNCDYFAPSLSGIHKPEYEMHSFFRPRPRYVDNFFVNAWTDEMKINLYKLAKHVLFVHRNPVSARAFGLRLKHVLGVELSYLQLSRWQEAEGVIEQAAEIDAPLVLFSAGPASKHIGPRIARGGRIGKVALDLGNASDSWLLEKLHKDALRIEAETEALNTTAQEISNG